MQSTSTIETPTAVDEEAGNETRTKRTALSRLYTDGTEMCPQRQRQKHGPIGLVSAIPILYNGLMESTGTVSIFQRCDRRHIVH